MLTELCRRVRVGSLLWALIGFHGVVPMSAVAQTSKVDSKLDTAKASAGYERAAEYSTQLGGRAVFVMVDGGVVFERYDNGWRADRPHPLASGTKSFAGVVAAAAVEDGLISWDELVSDTITQWKRDPRKSKITVRHLLNLSSGLDPAESILQGSLGTMRAPGQADADRSKLAPDRFEAALDVGTHHEPGTKFEYGPSHFYAFGAFLEAKLKAKTLPGHQEETYTAYMTRRVLDPLGVRFGARGSSQVDAEEGNATTGFWGKDQAGHLNLPGGAAMTAREWAKFGEFIRLQGLVRDTAGNSRQLIGWDVLSECFKPSAANKGYGLTWWLPTRAMAEDDSTQTTAADHEEGGTLRERLRRRVRDKALAQELEQATQLGVEGKHGAPLTVYMAAGLGKQRLYVVPEFGLTVVRFSANTAAGRKFSNVEFLRPILDEVKATRRLDPPQNADK